MKVASFNGCKVYNLSTGNSQPAWLSENKKRKLAKDNDYRKRLELIQDFEMPTAVNCMKMTKDGEHIVACGTYPPIVKCFTVSDLALKFQRGLTCEVVAVESLSDDYGKLVFLQADRTLSFHAPYGKHYSLRIPKFGRDLAYDWGSCDMFVSSSSNEVYRMNLSTGMFREPYELDFGTENGGGCNKLQINPMYNRLLACGGSEASCQFFDTRIRKSVSKITVDHIACNNNTDKRISVTALQFDSDGHTLGLGTSNGYCIMYDIRSSKPLYVKEHQYGVEMVDITFHTNNSSKYVLSTDKKVVKVWSRDAPTMGNVLTNVECPVDINSIIRVKDKRGESGMLMIGGEQSKVMNYYIPQLGPAPRWCSFLENITEELEESTTSSLIMGGAGAGNSAATNVYEDYKFVTKAEMEELGATGLIGTPMLKGYMHGFFMEMKLYSKLRAVSKPFEYEEYRKKKIQEKLEEKRKNRISAAPSKKSLPTVNKELAERLLKNQKKQSKASDAAGEVAAEAAGEEKKGLVDSRFAALFNRSEFQVDESTEDYLLRHPVKSAHQLEREAKMKKGRGAEDEDELYESGNDDDSDGSDEEEEENSEGDYGSDEDEDEDDELNIRHRGDEDDAGGHHRKIKKSRRGDDDEGEFSRATKKGLEKRLKSKSTPAHFAAVQSKGPRMYQVSDKSSSSSSNNQTLAERLSSGATAGAFGSEYTYKRGGRDKHDPDFNVDTGYGTAGRGGRGGGRGRGGGGRGGRDSGGRGGGGRGRGGGGRGRGRGGGGREKSYTR